MAQVNTTTPAAPVDAVVMAGSVNKIPLYPGDRPGRKALVELNGKPLIAYALDALQAARGVDRIFVVGAPEVIQVACRWPKVTGVPEGKSIVENAELGLQAATTERVLFCHPDQPLLRPRMIDDFLRRARTVQEDADVVLTWISYENKGRYEEADHKFAEFGDGKFTHGNLILVRKDLPDLPQVRQRLEGLYKARKNALRWAWALGPRLFTRLVIATALRKFPALEELQEMVGKQFGVRLKGVFSPDVELALDIDEPEDYAAAEKYLAEDAERAKNLRVA